MKIQTQIDELLTLRASEWFEILKNPTDDDRAAFVAWLGESRRHVQEFMEVAAVDDAVGEMPAAMRDDLSALMRQVTPPASRLPRRARPMPRSGSLPARRHRRVGLWGTAAAVLIAATFWATWLRGTNEFSTGIGEQRTVSLADTSLVTLNADSELQLHLTRDKRDIDLRRGEALFKVARDTRRPFRVHTRAGVVQALGTQFNVYTRPDGHTRVSVLEGRVQLTALTFSGSVKPETLILAANEEADLRLDGTIRRNTTAAVDKTVAWRERRLAFSDALLEDMVTEFNRYNRTIRLRLEDVPAGTYRFAGIFDADDPESLAGVLAREADLEVLRQEGEIVIRRR